MFHLTSPKSYDELNGWLLDHCVAYAKAHPHPEFKGKTVWQAFEAERASLAPDRARKVDLRG